MNTPAVEHVIEVDRRRMVAMGARDVETLGTLLSDDLIYTHQSGRLDTKASLIGAMISGTTVYSLVEPADVVGQDLGGSVVLTGSAHILVTASGTEYDFTVRFTNVYSNSGSDWQMVAWQATRLPD
jgi:hypothetical protein